MTIINNGISSFSFFLSIFFSFFFFSLLFSIVRYHPKSMYSACDKIINVGVNIVIETTNKMFHQFVQYLQSYSGCHFGSIVYRAASISELTVSALIGIKYLMLCATCFLIIQCVKRSCMNFTVLLTIAKAALYSNTRKCKDERIEKFLVWTITPFHSKRLSRYWIPPAARTVTSSFIVENESNVSWEVVASTLPRVICFVDGAKSSSNRGNKAIVGMDEENMSIIIKNVFLPDKTFIHPGNRGQLVWNITPCD